MKNRRQLSWHLASYINLGIKNAHIGPTGSPGFFTPNVSWQLPKKKFWNSNITTVEEDMKIFGNKLNF